MPFNNEYFHCEYCKKKYPFKDQLQQHIIQKHIRERPFECLKCNKTYLRAIDLRCHEKLHSAIKSFKYNKSKKRFTQKYQQYNLEVHHETDSQEKLFNCSQCNKNFVRTYQLINHKKTHKHFFNNIVLKKFICNYCSKEYIKRTSFINHIRSHTGEKPYKCDLCDQYFKSSCNVWYHKKNHCENSFKCQDCKKQFATKHSLKQHNLLHKVEKPCVVNLSNKINISSANKILSLDKNVETALKLHNSNTLKEKIKSKFEFKNQNQDSAKKNSDKILEENEEVPTTKKSSQVIQKTSAKSRNQKLTEIYKCAQCKISFNRKKFLIAHLSKILPCEFCELTFDHVEGYESHVEVHNKDIEKEKLKSPERPIKKLPIIISQEIVNIKYKNNFEVDDSNLVCGDFEENLDLLENITLGEAMDTNVSRVNVLESDNTIISNENLTSVIDAEFNNNHQDDQNDNVQVVDEANNDKDSVNLPETDSNISDDQNLAGPSHTEINNNHQDKNDTQIVEEVNNDNDIEIIKIKLKKNEDLENNNNNPGVILIENEHNLNINDINPENCIKLLCKNIIYNELNKIIRSINNFKND